jgi:hypothetical protein
VPLLGQSEHRDLPDRRRGLLLLAGLVGVVGVGVAGVAVCGAGSFVAGTG